MKNFRYHLRFSEVSFCHWWLRGATKCVTVTRVLVTLFADLGYLVPLLEGARFDTRGYMKGTWRCTRSCTFTAPVHHFRISQYPKRLPPILKMNFFSDKELRAL